MLRKLWPISVPYIGVTICVWWVVWEMCSQDNVTHAQAQMPAQYDLRDREVRIGLLIEDYQLAAQFKPPGVGELAAITAMRARAEILSALRAELTVDDTQTTSKRTFLADSVGIVEGAVIDAPPRTCECRWRMLMSEPPKYRLEQKCEICKQKERELKR